MIKAVIFDLDGLLIDSEKFWLKADSIIIKSFGHIYDENSPIREKIRGRGTRECSEIFVNYFKLNETVENFMQRRWDIGYPLLEKDLKLTSGAKTLIHKLSKHKVLLALATGGHTEEKVQMMFKKLGIDKFFTLLVSGLTVKKGKPDPEIYLLAAKKLKVNPSECIVLEDAVNGVLSAKSAGMKAFGVNRDKKIRNQLKKAKADEIFKSLEEIKIKNLFNYQ